MKKLLLLISVIIPLFANAAWKPMVVEGRTWTYWLALDSWSTGPNHLLDLKIKGTSVINDLEYHNVYSYTDGQLDTDIPYYFLRETSDNKVYAIVNADYPLNEMPIGDCLLNHPIGKEFLVCDMNNPRDTEAFQQYCDAAEFEPFTYMTPKGIELNGWKYGIQLIEGLGFVIEEYATPICQISSPAQPHSTMRLYQIKDADGEIYYENPANRPPKAWKRMVVEGRTWTYLLKTGNYDPQLCTENQIDLKIEGSSTEYGGDRYSVYTFTDGILDTDIPYFYLRETVDGNVYAQINKDYPINEFLIGKCAMTYRSNQKLLENEFLLLSMADPSKSDSYYPWVNEPFEYEEFEYIAPKGLELNGWKCVSPESGVLEEYTLIEGLGFIIDGGAMLLSPIEQATSPLSSNMYLYQVKDADGVVYYQNDKYNPLGSVNAIEADSNDTAPVYYNLNGQRVERPANGLFIEKRGANVRKVAK